MVGSLTNTFSLNYCGLHASIQMIRGFLLVDCARLGWTNRPDPPHDCGEKRPATQRDRCQQGYPPVSSVGSGRWSLVDGLIMNQSLAD